MPKFHDPRIEQVAPDALRPHPRNARTHSKKQIRQIAASIERFGFTCPALVSDDLEIVAGHGRVLAAQQLGLASVPVIRLSHLDAAERRAYMLADNQHALNAGWDKELLAIELQDLIELEFDIPAIGFDMAEVDLVIEAQIEADPSRDADPDDAVPPLGEMSVTRMGDVWQLGRHRLVCGDARDPAAYDALLGDEVADILFTDPPYNVPIARNVSGRGNAFSEGRSEALIIPMRVSKATTCSLVSSSIPALEPYRCKPVQLQLFGAACTFHSTSVATGASGAP